MIRINQGVASQVRTPNGFEFVDTSQDAKIGSSTAGNGYILLANGTGCQLYSVTGHDWVVANGGGWFYVEVPIASQHPSNTFVEAAGIDTAGLGVPSIYAENTITAQTTSGTTITTYTTGGGGNFEITAEYLITAYTSGSAEIQVSWTDEGGTARTATLLLADLSGTTATGAAATGPFSAIPYRLRSSANNAITIKTAGTFSATYDASATIKQTGF